MKKDFTIARKPGSKSPARPTAAPSPRPEEKAVEQEPQTTRKTIEVPEEYFVMVKVRAAKRRIREKDLWAEILRDYFAANPEG